MHPYSSRVLHRYQEHKKEQSSLGDFNVTNKQSSYKTNKLSSLINRCPNLS